MAAPGVPLRLAQDGLRPAPSHSDSPPGSADASEKVVAPDVLPFLAPPPGGRLPGARSAEEALATGNGRCDALIPALQGRQWFRPFGLDRRRFGGMECEAVIEVVR